MSRAAGSNWSHEYIEKVGMVSKNPVRNRVFYGGVKIRETDRDKVYTAVVGISCNQQELRAWRIWSDVPAQHVIEHLLGQVINESGVCRTSQVIDRYYHNI